MENEQIKSDNKSLNIIEKPVYYGQKGRALVWYYRYYSAYNMAQIIDGEQVTEEEYKKAFNILKSCIYYALADAHKWERDNTFERYANSEQSKQDGARLDKRREKLQQSLNRYGLEMVNFGLYPTICDKETHQRTGRNIALYYFN